MLAAPSVYVAKQHLLIASVGCKKCTQLIVYMPVTRRVVFDCLDKLQNLYSDSTSALARSSKSDVVNLRH